MRVLVTGGAGYIGSVVAALLLDRGHEVTVLDDLSTGHADGVPPGARFVTGSVADPEAVRVALAGDGGSAAAGAVDGVLHFAAKSLVAESVADPAAYWRTNVCGTQNLLDGMRDAGVGRVVFSSTAATYGEPDEVPIPESALPRPTNPYGASKLAVDHMLTSYAKAYGLAAVSLRYFNVAGAFGAFGERHAVETHLIPLLLQVVAGERESAQVYGQDYPTPDGTAVRDYIHVADLAEAHLLALEAAVAGEHRIYNLGSGRGYSVREVLDAVRSATGHPLPAVDAPRRAGDPAVLVASNARAAADLGWTPERGLEQMVRDAWTFAQTSGHGDGGDDVAG